MISNSTVLIHLSKINALWLLKDLYAKILIPQAVYDEVCIKEKKEYDQLIRAVQEGWLKVISISVTQRWNLDAGETEVLNVALELKEPVILDDAAGRAVAKTLGIQVFRTTSVIMEAYSKQLITSVQAKHLLTLLVESGYYLSPRFFVQLIEALKSDDRLLKEMDHINKDRGITKSQYKEGPGQHKPVGIGRIKQKHL